MTSLQQQMNIAENTLEMMAETVGSLEQSIEEWKQTLETAKRSGMMNEFTNEVKAALIISYSAVNSCVKSIKGIDGSEIYSIMQKISTASNNTVSVPNGNLRFAAYEKGKSKLKNKIKRPAGGYGKFNDFNVQLKMLRDLIEVTESIQSHINIISESYRRYHFTLQQNNFMVQFVHNLNQKCFTPRAKDFSDIKIKIEATRQFLIKIELNIKLALI